MPRKGVVGKIKVGGGKEIVLQHPARVPENLKEGQMIKLVKENKVREKKPTAIVTFDSETMAKLKEAAQKNGIPVTEVIRQMVDYGLTE